LTSKEDQGANAVRIVSKGVVTFSGAKLLNISYLVHVN